MATSAPLLKFVGGRASLQRGGLALLESLAGPVSVIIAVGSGRSGKSWLLDRLGHSLGCPAGTFRSAPCQEPVTEGIDVAACPLPSGGHLILMDCEGGDNAQGPIRLAVDVLAMLVASQVVYVANGRLAEPQLQSLGALAAARERIQPDVEVALPCPGLLLVVNKMDPTLQEQRLEELLQEGHEDASRNELRATIKGAFEPRQLHSVPFGELAGFQAKFDAFARAAVDGARTLQVAGVPTTGKHLAIGLRDSLQSLERHGGVRMPDLLRSMVLHEYLMPKAQELLAAFREQLPAGNVFIPNLASSDPRGQVLGRFAEQVSSVSQQGLKEEAAAWLRAELDNAWQQATERNEQVGLQPLDCTVEDMEVHLRTYDREVGRGSRKYGLAGPRKAIKRACAVYERRTRTRTVLKNGTVEHTSWSKAGEFERLV